MVVNLFASNNLSVIREGERGESYPYFYCRDSNDWLSVRWYSFYNLPVFIVFNFVYLKVLEKILFCSAA